MIGAHAAAPRQACTTVIRSEYRRSVSGSGSVLVVVCRSTTGDHSGEGAGAEAILRAAIRAHLRALLDVSDYSSANVRIFGQVPQSVRDANLHTRRAYEAEWDNLLSRIQADGALKREVDIRRLRLMLIGALNATLEWFDPHRGSAEALSRTYADVFLNGILERQET